MSCSEVRFSFALAENPLSEYTLHHTPHGIGIGGVEKCERTHVLHRIMHTVAEGKMALQRYIALVCVLANVWSPHLIRAFPALYMGHGTCVFSAQDSSPEQSIYDEGPMICVTRYARARCIHRVYSILYVCENMQASNTILPTMVIVVCVSCEGGTGSESYNT